ncbi:hypothetical protein CRYUN_Cryun20dG0067800 [Craigia yunnanensis]
MEVLKEELRVVKKSNRTIFLLWHCFWLLRKSMVSCHVDRQYVIHHMKIEWPINFGSRKNERVEL